MISWNINIPQKKEKTSFRLKTITVNQYMRFKTGVQKVTAVS